jgi:hypothetical protein
MRIELNGQDRQLALRDYLRQLGCIAFIGDDEHSVEAYTTATKSDEEREQLRVWVEAWNKLNAGNARLDD